MKWMCFFSLQTGSETAHSITVRQEAGDCRKKTCNEKEVVNDAEYNEKCHPLPVEDSREVRRQDFCCFYMLQVKLLLVMIKKSFVYNCFFTIELQCKDPVLSQSLMAEDQIAEHAIIQNTEVLSDKKSEYHVSDLLEEENIVRHKYFIFCCIIFPH